MQTLFEEAQKNQPDVSQHDSDQISGCGLNSLQVRLTSSFLSLCTFLISLDAAVFAMAMPHVGDEFKSNNLWYYDAAIRITCSVSQYPQRKFYEMYPVKWTLLASILMLNTGILVSGLAPGSLVFLIGRVMVGLGLSGIYEGRLVLSHPSASHTVYIDTSEYLAIAGAPLVGKAFLSSIPWRWCFHITLALSTVPVVLLWHLKLPATARFQKAWLQTFRERDLLHYFFLAPAMLCFWFTVIWLSIEYDLDTGKSSIVLHSCNTILLLSFFGRSNKEKAIARGVWLHIYLSVCQSLLQHHIPLFLQILQCDCMVQSASSLIFSLSAGILFTIAARRTMTFLAFNMSLLVPIAVLGIAIAGMMIRLTPLFTQGFVDPLPIILSIGSVGSLLFPHIASQAVTSFEG